MTADVLLERLEYVRRAGDGRWNARCPAHDDKDPSLSIAEQADGRVLIRCHAGCGALEILTSVGLNWGALFPPDSQRYRPIMKPRKDIEHERAVLQICAADRAAGKRLTREELAREREAWIKTHGGAA